MRSNFEANYLAWNVWRCLISVLVEWNHTGNKETFHLRPNQNVDSKKCTTSFFCGSKRIIASAWWCSNFNTEEKININVKMYLCHICFWNKVHNLKAQRTNKHIFCILFLYRDKSNIKQVFNIEVINNKARWLTCFKSSF